MESRPSKTRGIGPHSRNLLILCSFHIQGCSVDLCIFGTRQPLDLYLMSQRNRAFFTWDVIFIQYLINIDIILDGRSKGKRKQGTKTWGLYLWNALSRDLALNDHKKAFCYYSPEIDWRTSNILSSREWSLVALSWPHLCLRSLGKTLSATLTVANFIFFTPSMLRFSKLNSSFQFLLME